MKKIFFILLCPTISLLAQFEIKLQNSFQIFVNDSAIQLNQSWFDSLKLEANHGKVYFQLSESNTNKRVSKIKVKMPQTLKFTQVIRQVILYYNMLNNEGEKEREILLLYPFFTDIEKPEFIKCYYSDYNYYFSVYKWETVPIPSHPTPEEKFIYNQILKSAMKNTLVFGELPEDAFKEVSQIHNIPVKEVHNVYEKVVLWNACR
jgi:hypothetical protein